MEKIGIQAKNILRVSSEPRSIVFSNHIEYAWNCVSVLKEKIDVYESKTEFQHATTCMTGNQLRDKTKHSAICKHFFQLEMQKIGRFEIGELMEKLQKSSI